MQRKKPYETIIDTKEVNLEKKIITRTITNYNSEQKSPGKAIDITQSDGRARSSGNDAYLRAKAIAFFLFFSHIVILIS